MSLRIEIDGSWSAEDFARMFASVNDIYSVFALVKVERDSAEEMERYFREFEEYYPFPLRRLPRRLRGRFALQQSMFGVSLTKLIDGANLARSFESLENDERLMVRRCTYASPGVTDFTGLGQALGHLKDVIIKLIDVKTASRERNIRNQILEEELQAAALKNVREKIAILKELGYTEADLRSTVAALSPSVLTLEKFVDRGMIMSAQIQDDNHG
jgi:hypothetical protein